MTDTLIASAVVAAITILGVVPQLYAANRRWRKKVAAYFARLAEQAGAPGHRLTAELRLPTWEPWRPDPQLSAARVESASALLNATANDVDN